MPRIYNESPFYERDNIVKNYYKLLALPGRYAQSAEFIEIQSLLLECIKSIGDSLFKDGNVQSGCEVVINENEVTITAGRMYIDGVVRETKESKLVIKGEGVENITARIEETVVTEDEDDSLLDQAVGSSSSFQPGCFRVKQEVVYEVDGEGYVVATLYDGALRNFIVEKPQMDVISEVLARRTFAESGNYVVDGFLLKDEEYETETQVLVGLTKGQAFIKGYEVHKPTDTTFNVDKALTTRDVIGEPKTYRTDAKTFELINNPLNEVTRVFVTLTNKDTMVFNSLVREYELKKSPVANITKVIANKKTYIKGVDYNLSNNKIVWTGKDLPANGVNFEVYYTYKSLLVEGEDYVIHKGDKASITIENSNMLDNSEVLIDYSYYLARMDTVCLNERGMVIVVKGIENDLDECYAPEVTDSSCLVIGTVLVYPNSNKYELNNDTIRVSTMQRIQNAIERLDKLEYNTMMTTLDQEILAQENSEQLRGMFTEAFVNYDRIDETFGEVRLSIDAENGRMYPYFEEETHLMLLENNANNRYGVIGDVYTLPYTKEVAISQLDSTSTMLINPYQAFDPIMAIDISPSIDTWINTKTVRNEQTQWVTRNYAWWSGYTRNANQVLSTQNKGTTTKDVASTYMRQIQVKIVSKTFPREATNIKCTFAGRDVNLTPINGTQRGDSAGSVRPDANGLVEATFTIPANVPCGTVEVKLKDGILEGITSFRATGIERTITQTVLITRINARYVDPLAQTFQFSETRVLTGADLYLCDKDNHSLTVQIRNVELGLPGRLVYAESVLHPNNINVSSNGKTLTHVDFPNVVLCEKDTEYCIVLLTDSPKLRSYVAQLGKHTLDKKKIITSNPYTGVLLSSANASTWTPHQDMDLTFRIYTARFESKGQLNFSNIVMNDADRMLYTIDILNSVSTSTKVQANVNNKGFKIVNPWTDYNLDEYGKNCKVKIDLSTNDPYQSPLINKDSANVVAFKSENSATYISKNMVLDEQCNEAKVMLNTSVGCANNVKVWIATDGIGQAWTELTSPTRRPIDPENVQLIFNKTGLKVQNFRIKVTISTDNTCNKPYISKLGVILNESV